MNPPNKGGIVPDGPEVPFYFTDMMRRLITRVINQVEHDRVNKAPEFRLTYRTLEIATGMPHDSAWRALSRIGRTSPQVLDKIMHALGLNCYDLLDQTKLRDKGLIRRPTSGKSNILVKPQESIEWCMSQLLALCDGFERKDPTALKIKAIYDELVQHLQFDRTLTVPGFVPIPAKKRRFKVQEKKPKYYPWMQVPVCVSAYMREFAVTKEFVRSFILHELEVHKADPVQSSPEAHIQFKLGCSAKSSVAAIRWATKGQFYMQDQPAQKTA